MSWWLQLLPSLLQQNERERQWHVCPQMFTHAHMPHCSSSEDTRDFTLKELLSLILRRSFLFLLFICKDSIFFILKYHDEYKENGRKDSLDKAEVLCWLKNPWEATLWLDNTDRSWL